MGEDNKKVYDELYEKYRVQDALADPPKQQGADGKVDLEKKPVLSRSQTRKQARKDAGKSNWCADIFCDCCCEEGCEFICEHFICH